MGEAIRCFCQRSAHQRPPVAGDAYHASSRPPRCVRPEVFRRGGLLAGRCDPSFALSLVLSRCPRSMILIWDPCYPRRSLPVGQRIWRRLCMGRVACSLPPFPVASPVVAFFRGSRHQRIPRQTTELINVLKARMMPHTRGDPIFHVSPPRLVGATPPTAERSDLHRPTRHVAGTNKTRGKSPGFVDSRSRSRWSFVKETDMRRSASRRLCRPRAVWTVIID